MRIKIEGATPGNIAATITDIMNQFQVEMGTANIYINFTQNGHSMVYVGSDKYEELNLQRTLDPHQEAPPMTLEYGEFLAKGEVKNRINELRIKKENEQREIKRMAMLGFLVICKKDDYFKIFTTKQEPDEKYYEKKEKAGYQLALTVKHPDKDGFLMSLKKYFREEHKIKKKGPYSAFIIIKEDIELIKEQDGVEIIKEKIWSED